MIDIIQQLRAANPALGATILVLRPDSRALDGPERLTAAARAWLAAHAPDARLSREAVLLAPYPGAEPQARIVTVLAFADARGLAAFATTWTGDPPDDDAAQGS